MAKEASQWIVKHPVFMIFAALLITSLASWGLPPVFNSDFEVYFGPKNHHLKTYRQMQDDFTTTDNVFIVVAPQDGKVFTQPTLSIVKELTEAGWQLPYATRVDSITNYQHTTAQDDDLQVDDLIPDPATASAQQLEAAKQIALAEPQLLNRLISPSAHVTGINITFNLPDLDKSKEIPEVVTAVRSLLAGFEQRYSTVSFYTSGRLMNNNGFREASLHDVSTIVPIAFGVAVLFIAGFLYATSHNVTTMLLGTGAVIIIIVSSILTAMGIASWLGIELSPPVANAPTMILTLAIADCIHILASYFQYLHTGMSRREAMAESLRVNQQPVFLTSLTTVIGFLSLNYSDSPPFQDLGNVVALGVIAAWLFAMTLLPAMAVLLPVKLAASHQQKQPNHRLANAVIRFRVPFFVISCAAIIITASFAPKNTLNDVWAEYFDERTELRQNSDFIRQNLTSSNSIEFALKANGEGAIADPEYLAHLEAFSAWLSEQPEIIHVFTFTDVMKRLNKTLHNDDPAWYQLPESRELASQYLLLYELSLPFGLDLNNQITMNKDATRVIGTIRDSSTATVLALQDRAQAWLRENTPDYFYHPGTSSDVMFAHIGYSNIRSMLEGTFIALLLISIILGIALRSVKFGLVSLLPNLIPAAVAFGFWGIIDGEIGLGLSVVAGMTLGIVVDYTVHFLSKYLRAQREFGLNEPESVRYAFSTVGTALMVTTLILTANFGVLAMSDFALNGDMGLLTAVTIVVALMVDFFFLPPLLLFLGRRKPAPNSDTDRQTRSLGIEAADVTLTPESATK